MSRKTLLHLNKWLVLLIVALGFIVSPAMAQGNSHIVQRGETLYRIALRYGFSVDALAQHNGLANPNQIYAGQTLLLPTPGHTAAPAPVASANTAPVYHVVQRGETLGIIANRYGVTWQELASANGLVNPNRIVTGQQLRVMTSAAPQTAATAPTAAPEPAPSPEITSPPPASAQARTHVVQPGETLSRIARQYNLSWTTIARANNVVDPNRIFVGQQLSIPAEDDAGGSTYLQPTTGQPSGPTPTITNGKQIIVDLSDQRVYAYQNGQLVRNVVVSTGLPGTPTVQGDYNVYWKLNSQTMSGPGYYLPGVPWVMYFYQGYAMHGTYWHNNFGSPMSHGCVNLPTDDAAWFFTFAEVGTSVRVIG